MGKDEMTAHQMALNPQVGGNKGRCQSVSLAAYDQLVAQPWLGEMVARIRGGEEQLKGKLPFRCAHYYRFGDGRRRQASIDPEAFLYQTSVDIDDASLVGTALEMARMIDTQQGPWQGKLLHMEYSARKKLHIDIRMPVGMTIEEAQRAYCETLGVPCDESCFSPERIIYVTDIGSEIYRSPGWYALLPQEELRLRREAFAKRGLASDGRKLPMGTQAQGCRSSAPKPSVPKSSAQGGLSQDAAPRMAGQPLPKSLAAFDLCRRQAGLGEVDINADGSRHSSLLAILSAGASRVMGEEELRRVVATRMPAFAAEHDCQQLIHDFYERYGDTARPLSREMMRINAEAEKSARTPQAAPVVEESDDNSEQPEMPAKLPRLVELLVSKTPDIYKPAVACAIFPPLATHLRATTFRYIDNVDHEATLMCALLAGTGAGKNCVQTPINLIMADIRERDRKNLLREKEWKEEMTRRSANKDKRKRPDNLVIQEIDADMTNPAFVLRTAEAQGHFLYTSLNEIDQFDALKGQGNQQFRIMCLAFDPGNQYGQTRVGTQSVTERVCIRFNWNASTTIHKGQRYFSKVLTDGPVSRINFCTIPEREIGAEMPIYGTYDEQFAAELKPYVENLCRATGRIDCPEAYQLAMRLKEENADYARMTQSRVFENLSFRANVIAYLKACVLYVANGLRWEPEMDDFIRWSERYDLYCKMRFFGDAIAQAETGGEKSNQRGPKNMLQLLPDVFTQQEAEQVRMANGLDRQGTRQMLYTWLHRKYIRRAEKSEDPYTYSSYSFEKLMFRGKKN